MKIEFNAKSSSFISNILNEVCYGFAIDQFDEKIGATRLSVEALLEKLLAAEKSGITAIPLDDREVKVLRNALHEVEREIEEWEFSTRIGATLDEMYKIPVFANGKAR